MKNTNKIKFLILIITLTISIGVCIKLFFYNNVIFNKQRQIIKEMNESEYDSQITELNKSHIDYATQVQANKKKIAEAITSQKVTTSENATVDEIVTNIGKIFETRTSDATAMAEDILKGKTAYVNGELITGTGEDNISYVEQQGYGKLYYLGSYSFANWDGSATNRAINFSINVTNIDGYKNFTENNFLIGLEKSGACIYIPLSGQPNYSKNSSVTYSYNASNGVLTVSKPAVTTTSVNGYFAMTCDTTAKIWLYTGSDIINLAS